MSSTAAATRHRVVVIDDHHMLREGLTAGLDSHEEIDVIGSSPSVSDFKASFQAWDATVVVADYQLAELKNHLVVVKKDTVTKLGK